MPNDQEPMTNDRAAGLAAAVTNLESGACPADRRVAGHEPVTKPGGFSLFVIGIWAVIGHLALVICRGSLRIGRLPIPTCWSVPAWATILRLACHAAHAHLGSVG